MLSLCVLLDCSRRPDSKQRRDSTARATRNNARHRSFLKTAIYPKCVISYVQSRVTLIVLQDFCELPSAFSLPSAHSWFPARNGRIRERIKECIRERTMNVQIRERVTEFMYKGTDKVPVHLQCTSSRCVCLGGRGV